MIVFGLLEFNLTFTQLVRPASGCGRRNDPSHIQVVDVQVIFVEVASFPVVTAITPWAMMTIVALQFATSGSNFAGKASSFESQCVAEAIIDRIVIIGTRVAVATA